MRELLILLTALLIGAMGACSKTERQVPRWNAETEKQASRWSKKAEKIVPGSNRVADSELAPKLLLDKEEIAKYVSDFPQGDYKIFDVPNVGKFYLDDNPALVKEQLKAGKPWEPEGIEFFSKHVAPGSTALDIGAHIGSLALPLARCVGPEGMVYAFEPQKKIYRELVKNLELNNIKNAVPLRFAVGAENRIIEMTPTTGRDGTMAVGAGGDKAELRTIDSFGFSNVSLIKMDVEGFEIPVLEGAKKTIQKWRPAILLEIWGFHRYKTLPPDQKKRIDGIRAFLEQNGYELYYAYDAGEPHFVAIYKGDQ